MLFYRTSDGRFMGFVFVSNTGRAGFAGRAAFHLEPGCPNQRCPEECLEKLIFSLPIHFHYNNNNNNENHTERPRHGFGRVGGGCGPGKREKEAESREKMGRKRLRYLGRVPGGGGGVGWRGRARQARRASITDGVRSGQREESMIQRRDRTGEGRRICGWPAGRACGTDGTQAASEKRPRQRGDRGGSIALGYFLP